MCYRRVSPQSIPSWILFLAANSDVNAYLGIQSDIVHIVLFFYRVDVISGDDRVPHLHLCITSSSDSYLVMAEKLYRLFSSLDHL